MVHVPKKYMFGPRVPKKGTTLRSQYTLVRYMDPQFVLGLAFGRERPGRNFPAGVPVALGPTPTPSTLKP